MIGILGLIAAKRPFPLLFKKRIKPLTPRSDQHETSLCNVLTLYRKQRMNMWAPPNIYHLSLAIYLRKTLDGAAVYGDGCQF